MSRHEQPKSRVSRDAGARRLDRALAGFRRSGDRSDEVPPRSRQLLDEPPVSQDELDEVAHEYRHVHEDHRRAAPRSRVRRQLDARLRELRRRFEHLLATAPVTDLDRRRWRDRLRGRSGSPPSATDLRPLLFRGRSNAGSELCLVEAPGGLIDAIVNGAVAAVLDDARELAATRPDLVFALNGLRFRETFGVSPVAAADLRDALKTGRRPRQKHVRELIADGLIDRNLDLTARGRRALALDKTAARHLDIGALPVISTRGPVSSGAREDLALALARVARVAPRPVIHINGSLTRHMDPALPHPSVVKASIAMRGRTVRAHAEAASERDAIDLLEPRLRRKLHELHDHELAQRRELGVAEPGEWRHGDLPA